tara:strand:- start:571 stop:993 length:423 start_codon:yes stop_codon:yes gene_type:complete
MANGLGVHSGIDSLLASASLQLHQENGQTKQPSIENILLANKDKNFVQRILDRSLNFGKEVFIEGDPSPMSHFMMQIDNLVIPRVVDRGEEVNGQPMLSLLTEDDAYDFALQTGEYIQMNNDEEALWFSKHYKDYWGQQE